MWPLYSGFFLKGKKGLISAEGIPLAHATPLKWIVLLIQQGTMLVTKASNNQANASTKTMANMREMEWAPSWDNLFLLKQD